MLNKILIIISLISVSAFSNAFDPIGNADILPVHFIFEETFNLSLNSSEVDDNQLQTFNNSFLSSSLKAGFHLTKRIDARAGFSLAHAAAPIQIQHNNCIFTNCDNLFISAPINKLSMSAYILPKEREAPLKIAYEVGLNYLIPAKATTNNLNADITSKGASFFFNISAQSSPMASQTMMLAGSIGFENYSLNLSGTTNTTSNYQQEVEFVTITCSIALIAQL